ncbi:unnamed protein product [Dovyalis caffra]|uniref:NAC domain-containing protein n=1 Tax=Dovyalis caffra TaxID=77055 RepID=A0AAV1R7A4_9ROSI|nr:unnamed protein product [Dovyalis caffra]
MEAGFKFQPSPEESISNYLQPKSRGDPVKGVPMAVINLCKNEPWELPDKAMIKLADQEWYFFCPRDLKYKKSKLANRKTKAGYWKLTSKIKAMMAEHTMKKISEDYVLCKLEKINRGEENHHMASSVSDSEAAPSQSMASDYEDKNRNEMTVNSASDGSELSHLVASDRFEIQNLNELMANSAPQVRELTSDFRNQNSNKLMSNSAYDGTRSSYSMAFNSEAQY